MANVPSSTDGALRTMRIIVFALCMGPVMFAVILLVALQIRPAPLGGNVSVLTAIGLVFAAGSIVMSFVIPPVLARAAIAKMPKDSDIPAERDIKWWGLYQTQMIIRAALLEGAAFFQLIAFQIERQVWSLGLFVVLLVLTALLFPTRAGVENWIMENDRRRRLEV